MLYPKPRICTSNLDDTIVEELKKRYENVFHGSLGNVYRTFDTYHSPQPLTTNYKFPENIHEYDVFILDLQKKELIQYMEDINYDPERYENPYRMVFSFS